jgi:hypothetical protein
MHVARRSWGIVAVGLFSLAIVSTATAKYSGGTGEPNDPYQIATPTDLIALGETPADYDKHFIMTADVDLDPNLQGRRVFDKAVIAPASLVSAYPYVQGTPFTGVFDGAGHTISRMTIRGDSYLGLFGQVGSGAEIKDLGVVDVNIAGSGNSVTNSVGGLVGYCYYGTVTQCYSTGAVKGTGQYNGTVGGLVGSNTGGRLTRCHSAGAVNATGQDACVGGLAGYCYYGTVTQCYSTGTVSGKSYVGGLVGLRAGYSLVTACFWDAQTSGQAASAGGTGKTTTEMQTAKTFLDAGWDFVDETTNGTEDIWWINEGKDYPHLSWEPRKYGGGTGEPTDPYLIFTTEQMNAIGAEANDWSKCFKLMADIDLSGFDGKSGRPAFNIIAPDTEPAILYYQGIAFTGVFDGGGHKLSHLTIQGASYVALFAQLGSTAAIHDLGIEDMNVTGSGDFIAALAAESRATITRCFSTGVVNATGRAQERAYNVGGLIASSFSDVTCCHSAATVIGGVYIGGLMGSNWGITTQCYSTGPVRGGGSVGGFVGENLSIMTRCYALGPVEGESDVGGLVGENYQGQVDDCYSTGAVIGGWYVGGLIGQNGAVTDAGKQAAVTHCYSAGPVQGQNRVGGLVGRNDATVADCFWDTQTSGQAASAGGESKTTTEMQTARTFLDAGWDFVGETTNGTDDIWWIDERKDYPRLWWELIPEN